MTIPNRPSLPSFIPNGLGFITAMWCSSRCLILITLLLIAPLLPVPDGGDVPAVGFAAFAKWDSFRYRDIATSGYTYAADGQGHSVAFFPLFPLLLRGLMSVGLSFEVAGLLINNLAFFAALVLIYRWVESAHHTNAARWAIAALVWCPFSLFGTVIYTEGVFLLLSTAALRAFEKKHHLWAAAFGILVTATRPPGMVLMPAFLITAWRDRRPPIAYVASLATGLGVALYSLYCYFQFGDPFAFIKVQKAWQPQQDFYGQDWLKMFVQVMAGNANWKAGGLVDPWHPLLFLLICGGFYGIWKMRQSLEEKTADIGYCVLALLLWLLAGTPLVNSAMVVGGGYLLWHFRAQLSPLLVLYGFLSLGFICSSGRADSAERYAYAIVSLAIALGLLLARHPRWGYPLMGLFAYLLVNQGLRFAQGLWSS